MNVSLGNVFGLLGSLGVRPHRFYVCIAAIGLAILTNGNDRLMSPGGMSLVFWEVSVLGLIDSTYVCIADIGLASLTEMIDERVSLVFV